VVGSGEHSGETRRGVPILVRPGERGDRGSNASAAPRSPVEAILVTVSNGGSRPIHSVRVDLEIAPGAFFDHCEFEFVAPNPSPPAQAYLKFRDDVWDGAGNRGAVPTIEFEDIIGNVWTRHGYDGELVLKKGHTGS
jgi:hypothetical protein